jgi:hypothetical protein
MRVRPQIRHRTTGGAGVRAGNECRSTPSGRAGLRGSWHPVAGGVVGQEGGQTDRFGLGEPGKRPAGCGGVFPHGPEAGKGLDGCARARPARRRHGHATGWAAASGPARRVWRGGADLRVGWAGGNRSAVPTRTALPCAAAIGGVMARVAVERFDGVATYCNTKRIRALQLVDVIFVVSSRCAGLRVTRLGIWCFVRASLLSVSGHDK